MGLFIYSISRHLIDTTYLNNCLGPRHLKYLPAPLSPIGEGEVDDLSILGELAGGGRAAQSNTEISGEVNVPFAPLLDSGPSFCLPSCAQTLLETNSRD